MILFWKSFEILCEFSFILDFFPLTHNIFLNRCVFLPTWAYISIQFSSLPARPQINNGNYGKSPYLTQSFPEEHQLLCICFMCFLCLSVSLCFWYLCVCVCVWHLGTLFGWMGRIVVTVRLRMCEMRMFCFVFLRQS